MSELLPVGTSVTLLRDVERYPHFIAPKGAHGIVTGSDPDLFRVKLAAPLAGAEEWDNEVIWSIRDEDDPSQDVAPAFLIRVNDDLPGGGRLAPPTVNAQGDLLCPNCGNDDVATWADDGEADNGDWFSCHVCGLEAALVRTDNPLLTQNGVGAVPTRTILIHLNVQAPVTDQRTAHQIITLVESALDVGLEGNDECDFVVDVALAEEI